MDAAAGSVLLLGIPVRVNAATQLEDEVGSSTDFGLDDIEAGDFLEVRGVADGMGGFTATELERDSPDDVRLRGAVEFFNPGAGTFTILGVGLQTYSGTSFSGFPAPGVATEADFYTFLAANPGAVISAKDNVDGNEAHFDLADEVELED